MKQSEKKLILSWIAGFSFGVAFTLFLLTLINKL